MFEALENWSVWTENKLTDTWTFEFEGSREACLQYLDVVTLRSCRLWNFVLVRPA